MPRTPLEQGRTEQGRSYDRRAGHRAFLAQSERDNWPRITLGVCEQVMSQIAFGTISLESAKNLARQGIAALGGLHDAIRDDLAGRGRP